MAVGKEVNFPACQKTEAYNEKAFNANWEYLNGIYNQNTPWFSYLNVI